MLFNRVCTGKLYTLGLVQHFLYSWKPLDMLNICNMWVLSSPLLIPEMLWWCVPQSLRGTESQHRICSTWQSGLSRDACKVCTSNTHLAKLISFIIWCTTKTWSTVHPKVTEAVPDLDLLLLPHPCIHYIAKEQTLSFPTLLCSSLLAESHTGGCQESRVKSRME